MEEDSKNINSKLEELESRLDSTETLFKENQTNLFTAIRIFMKDSIAYKQGKRGFPESALYGVITAYFRPRIVLTIGAIIAVIFTGIQTWILINQTRIISEQSKIMRWQSDLMESETWSNKASTIAEIMGTFESVNDTANIDIIMPFLWLLEGQEKDFIRTSRGLQPSYLSNKSWDESFHRFSSVLSSQSEIDDYVSLENEFIKYFHKFNLPYERFKQTMSSVVPFECSTDSLYSYFMKQRIFEPSAKWNDFLDLYGIILVEKYKSEMANEPNFMEPIYKDVRFMLPMVIPDFTPWNNDLDLLIREEISNIFFDEADQIWKQDLELYNKEQQITDRFENKLKSYFSDLKRLLLEKNIAEIREDTNIIQVYFN